jgi:hypothetical protein
MENVISELLILEKPEGLIAAACQSAGMTAPMLTEIYRRRK